MRFGWLFVAGCATTPAPPAPTDLEVSDVAHTVGSTLAGAGGEIDALDDAIAIAHGSIPDGFTAADGRVTGSRLGMRYTYAVTCRDANVQLVACGDDAETADVVAMSGGSVELPGFSATGSRVGAWTLGGLSDVVAMVDGTTDFTFDLALAAGTRYHLDDHVTHTGVAVADGRPFDGAIHATIEAAHVDGASERDLSLAADIRLDAGEGELVVDGHYHFAIDLASGAVTPTE